MFGFKIKGLHYLINITVNDKEIWTFLLWFQSSAVQKVKHLQLYKWLEIIFINLHTIRKKKKKKKNDRNNFF